jgi:hypothetical protein
MEDRPVTRIPRTLGLCVIVLASVACGSSAESKAAQDVCSHCAGNQKMTAKGTCESCGMAVDVCAAWPGEQTLTADGTCSGCGAKVAVQ